MKFQRRDKAQEALDKIVPLLEQLVENTKPPKQDENRPPVDAAVGSTASSTGFRLQRRGAIKDVH